MVCQLVLLVVFVDYSRRVIHGTDGMSVGAVGRVCRLFQ